MYRCRLWAGTGLPDLVLGVEQGPERAAQGAERVLATAQGAEQVLATAQGTEQVLAAAQEPAA